MIGFFVAGNPKPQGSKRAIMGKHQKYPSVIESAGRPLKDWRAAVSHDASAHGPPTAESVKVTLMFFLTRPKGHYGTGRNAGTLKPSAPLEHIQTPDIDKLARAVLDGLTGRVYIDDSQVVELVAVKCWQPRGLLSGCEITVDSCGSSG